MKDLSLLAVDFKPGQLRNLRGYEVVQNGPNIVMNQIYNTASAACPAGKIAVGGGGSTGGGIVAGDGPYIVVDGPSVNGSSWLVQTARAQPGYSALVAFAICANVP